jgi:2-iminobutanoate/2-iminopropanoate deaminase
MSDRITCYQEIPNAPKAVGPYSPVVRAGGLVFLSGQIPLHPTTGQLVGNDIKAQTEQVLANLKAVLGNFQTVNALYSEALGEHKPARSTIQVSALPREAAVEIEMIALDKAA